MRHCFNENVEVFEATGPALPALLRKAADQIESLEDEYSYSNVHVSMDINTCDYIVTLYSH